MVTMTNQQIASLSLKLKPFKLCARAIVKTDRFVASRMKFDNNVCNVTCQSSFRSRRRRAIPRDCSKVWQMMMVSGCSVNGIWGIARRCWPALHGRSRVAGNPGDRLSLAGAACPSEGCGEGSETVFGNLVIFLSRDLQDCEAVTLTV